MRPQYIQRDPSLNPILKSLSIATLLLIGLFFLFRPATTLSAAPTVAAQVESNRILGRVSSGSGSPVEGAMIQAQRRRDGEAVVAMTDATGNYTLTLDSGLWSLTAQHTTATVPNDWYWNRLPIVFDFKADGVSQTEVRHFDFLSSQAVVRGFVKLPDGTAPPFDVTVSLKTAEGYGISRPARDYDGFFWRVARSGTFTFQLIPESTLYAAPPPMSITLQPGDLIDVGEVQLLPKSAGIQAGVTDIEGNRLDGIDLIVWSADGGVSTGVTTATQPITVPVVAGTWNVRPSVPPDIPFFFDSKNSRPMIVTVGMSQTAVISDFVVLSAPNLITGTFVDGSGLPLMLDGWVTAEDGAGYGVRGTSVQSGTFNLYLPDGNFTLWPSVSPDNAHLSVDSLEISVSGGQTTTVELPILPAETAVSATLWDPREEEQVFSATGSLLAASGQSLNQTIEDPETSVYQLNLPPGDWSLGYGFTSGTHVALDRAFSLKVNGSASQTVQLPVAKIDSAVTGRVMGGDGEPLADATVHVRGETALLEQIHLQAETESDGRYYINLPHGSYTMWSDSDSASQNGWISPAKRRLDIGVKVIRPGIDLAYRQTNMTLSGNLTLGDSAPLTGTAHLLAQTGDGGTISAVVEPDGSYTLPLLRNTTWRLEGLYETDDTMYRFEDELMLTGDQTLGLVFDGGEAKAVAQIESFDSRAPAELYVDRQLKVFIPAGTLPVSGASYLHARPLPAVADRYFHQQIFPGYALDLFGPFGNRVSNSFNQTALITLRYDQAWIDAKDLNESQIRPLVLDLGSGDWVIPDHFVIDTANNQVTLETSFFSSYTLIAGEPNPAQIYLPLLQR